MHDGMYPGLTRDHQEIIKFIIVHSERTGDYKREFDSSFDSVV